MDEDVIVREIVKSLAFEIEATNEDNVLKWTSTNGTPLSVKVRVRNPDEPRLVQKGPFPIPRIGITAPDRLRLVSSDQTILSFNIYLDKDAQKQEEYKRSKLFQIFNIGGCLGTISDDDGPYLPSSSNQKAIAHKSSSRSESAIIDSPHTVPTHNESKKWPFGRCKPGGCLDPPFGEDKYHYAPSKADRRTKLALEIRELEKKEAAAEHVDSTLTEKLHLKPESKENYQQKLDTARQEVEPKKETDVLPGASAESRRKSKEGSLQCRSSVHISIKDELDSKKLTDIYARKSRENSLVTYHIDTSSTESLYGPVPNSSTKSYNESQRQTYEYPEKYFVPPKDVLRYKEEERRYSKEPSNYQIGVSGLPKENYITDKINVAKAVAVEHKPISQNARGSKDINMKKLKLTLTELQSNNVDVAQQFIEDKKSSTHLASDSKEPILYIPTNCKNIDDYRNVPDTRTETGFKTTAKDSTREKEDFKFNKPKKLRSGNDDFANIEANSNIPIKKSTIEKPDDIILSNEISKPLKLQASTLTELEPKSAELQPNNIDFAQKGTKDKASPTRLASDSKEPVSYILTDSKNVDDHKNVPDKILRSGNVDIANIEANKDIPIKVRTTEKPDNMVLSSDETYKPIKSQASPLSDSNIYEFSEVVKTNGRTIDKTHVSYPKKEYSNHQISASVKAKESDITEKSNLIKAGTVDHKPISSNERRLKDIHMQKIEPQSGELQPNNIDFAQKGTKDKASPTRLASDSKEPVSYILTDSKNVNDHKNVPDKILRSGNIDIANIEANKDIPIKVRTTEKLDDIVLSSDETYKPIKSQASPLSDSNIDEFSDVVKTNGHTLDETRVSYPIKESSNDQTGASGKVKEKVYPEAVKTMKDKKPNTYSNVTKEMQNNILPSSNTTDLYSDKNITKDKPLKKPSLPESRSHVVKLADSYYQDVSNVSSKADQTLPKTDLHKNRKTDIYTAPCADIETKKSTNQSGVVGSPYMQKEFSQDAQYELNDFNIRLPRESKTIDQEAFSSDKSLLGIPAQKLVADPDQQIASKQNYEYTKQLELNKVSNKQSISGYKNEEETVKINDGKTTLYDKTKKPSQITKDKPNLKATERDDYAALNKLYPEVQRHETNVKNDKSKYLTPSRKSSYENKEFDVSSTHSIDFMPKHLSSNELNDEIDTLPKKQTSAILQKTSFIPRRDLDIYDDDINKSTQLKRQTFTIIGSDTSLPKQEEIEETPKDVTNTYLKATDNAKSVSPSQTHDKTDILDARSEKLNTRMEPPHKTTQGSVNKNDFKITDIHKSVSKDQAHNKPESLNRINKAPGNIRDFILSGHQTDDIAETSENNKDMSGNITDLRSIINSDRHGLLGDQNRDESDTEKTEGNKKYTNKFDDVSSGSLLDKPIPDLYSKDTDYDRASPSTQVSEKSETLRPNNKDLEKTPNVDSTIDRTISQKHIQESTKPPKFTGNVKSALSPENRDNAEVISSDRNTVRNTESDKFSLTSKNQDKTENVTKAQENIIFKEIITDSHESLPENIKYLHSEATSVDMSIPVFPINNETGLSVSHDRSEKTRERDSSSEKFVQENVRDLYAHVTDDGKLTQYMQNREISESLSVTSKQMENKTYSSTTKDTSKKSIPQNQNFLYFEDIDHDELVTVVPKRDGNEPLVKSYKEQEDKMKLNDGKYKDIDGKIFTELGVNSLPKLVPENLPNIEQVTDDAKYIPSDQFEADFIGTDRNQILGRDRDLIQTNTRVSQDNELLGDTFSHMTIPTMSVIHGSNIDIAPKLDDDVYNVPINTLENISISTFEINRDSINKTITGAFDNVEHMIDDSDQVKQQSSDCRTIIKKPVNIDHDLPLKNNDISEKSTDYRSSKVPISVNGNIDLNRESFDTKPSVYIKGQEQNERTSPSLEVIKKSGSQNDISYLDMSFYSYINDDNQRVVQTYSPPNEQQRGNDATVTVVKTLIRHGNEVRIPVDKENDLTLNIVDKHSRVCNAGSSIGSPTRYPHREHQIVDHAKNQDVLTKNLALIYESGLIPLHNVIKDLTQQVNNLTAKQEILQELKRSVKRTKSMRLIPVVKRCGCKRI